MKKGLPLLVIALLFAALLSACGGGGSATPEPPAAAVEPAEESAPAPVEAAPAAVDEPTAESAPTEADTAPATDVPAEAPADAVDTAGGLQMSGMDPDTGLEINPAQPFPDVDYILRGKIVSFNLIPQTSPEFLIESPDGVRYRIQSQAVPDIYFEDGSQLLPHEYKRGMMLQATARLIESTSATSVMNSSNLVLLSETP